MSFRNFLVKPLAAAALLAVAGASQATITVYTTQATFNAATQLLGVDTFTGFDITGTTLSPITRSAGPYSYTAAASTTNFFGAGSTADPWLSTLTASDSIIFRNFSSGVQAVGGNFFGSDISGLFLSGNMLLTATDAQGTVSFTLNSATTSSFVGFVSSGAITEVTVCALQPGINVCGTTVGAINPFVWPTVDNLTLGQAAVVPEPGSYAMMLAGLGLAGFMARRRRA